MVFAEGVQDGSTRHFDARYEGHERKTLSTAAVSRYLGADGGKRQGVLQCHWGRPGELVESGLPESAVWRNSLGHRGRQCFTGAEPGASIAWLRHHSAEGKR